ncbi:hypothetical protein [Aquamicrobium sp.]|uniref:hypothetical protein n=1 Tax=Aquamicrobium sp. TaxID=1872579 RepID=UPI00258FB94E|nr:hypothetical protein [Aquamicrobium sp.]MCK9549285.1 hypothetical protein [Aquamicrobium sp.]
MFKKITISSIVLFSLAYADYFSDCSKGSDPFSASSKGCTPATFNQKHKIIVGTRQEDARVIYDTGRVLKVWIAPYYQGGTMISAHDNFVVVSSPRFVVGQSVDKNGNPKSGLTNSDDLNINYVDLDKKRLDKEVERSQVNQEFIPYNEAVVSGKITNEDASTGGKQENIDVIRNYLNKK